MFKFILTVLISLTYFTGNDALESQQSENSVEISQFPFFAHLEVESNYYGLLGKRSCSAVLIDDLWLVTSAYCLNNAERAYVLLGSPNASNNTSERTFETITVDKSNLIQHPQYSRLMSWNDIGTVTFKALFFICFFEKILTLSFFRDFCRFSSFTTKTETIEIHFSNSNTNLWCCRHHWWRYCHWLWN